MLWGGGATFVFSRQVKKELECNLTGLVLVSKNVLLVISDIILKGVVNSNSNNPKILAPTPIVSENERFEIITTDQHASIL